MSKVYILENADGISKLGFTNVAAESRRAMCSTVMCKDFSVIAYFDNPATPARQLERMGHNLLSDYRIATQDCNGNNCYEYYKMPAEVMAMLMAFLMEGTRNDLEFHEFGRQQPRAKVIRKLLFGIKRSKRAIAEGWILKSGASPRSWYRSWVDEYLGTEKVQGRSEKNIAANKVSNECVMRFNQEVCRIDELMTKRKQKTLPSFVEA